MMYCSGKGWPIAFGLGTGLGMAVSNCQHEFGTINSHMPGVSCFTLSRMFILFPKQLLVITVLLLGF